MRRRDTVRDAALAVASAGIWELARRRRRAMEDESFRVLVDSVEDYAIYMLSPRGHIRTWNAGAERAKGYRADEVIGRHYSLLHPPEDVERGVPEALLREAATSGTAETEGWRVRRDGSRFYAHVVITAVRGRGGELRGFAKVTRDISERRRIEEAREKRLAEEREARAAAEAAERRTAVLADAAALLDASQDGEDILSNLAQACVPALGEWCVVYLREPEGSIRRLAVAHADPGKEPMARALAARTPLAPEESVGPANVIRTGRPQLVPRISDAELEAFADSGEHLRLLRALDFRSSLIVPLESRGTILGALSFGAGTSHRPYGPKDLELAEQLARRSALAVDNARLYAAAREAERQKDESLALLDTLFDQAPTGLAFWTSDLRYVRVNEVLAAIDGVPASHHVGRGLEEVLGSLGSAMAPHLREVLASGEPVVDVELSAPPPAASPGAGNRQLLMTAHPVRGLRREQLGVGAAISDVTERRAVERALREADTRFRTAFENAPIGMALPAAGEHNSGEFLQVNRALCDIVGRPAAELRRSGFAGLADRRDWPSASRRLRQLLSGELETVSFELRLRHADGHSVWTGVSASLIRSADGLPVHAIAQIEDVTERKQFEGRLQYLADHDPLTGLFNRRRFEEELDREVAAAKRYGQRGAVLVLDLDKFKYVNDTYGHALGDDLINRVAAVLRNRLRETDIIGRLGGDEFAVVLPRIEPEQAQLVAADLVRSVRREADVTVEGWRLQATASVGITLIDPRANLSGEQLLVEADVAMYEAKESGRDRFTAADPAGPRRDRMRARLTWGQRIRDALQHDSFALYHQPIVCLDDARIESYELLVRMIGPEGQVIAPAEFLSSAERFGQIQAIDRWVVGSALQILEDGDRLPAEAALSVNLSGASLSDAALVDELVGAVKRSNVDHSRLTFEVTETATIVNVQQARRFAEKLTALGCTFALDDFGAGFGSFYYLKHFPFDCLKIDGDFVRNLPASLADQQTVKGIVQVARGLGKRTIGEFVEDEGTLELLREYGVDAAQGYHFGRPAPLTTSRFEPRLDLLDIASRRS